MLVCSRRDRKLQMLEMDASKPRPNCAHWRSRGPASTFGRDDCVGHEGDKWRCLAAGMDGYLTKPLRLQEMDEVLEK